MNLGTRSFFGLMVFFVGLSSASAAPLFEKTEILRQLEMRGIAYFLQNAHPVSGLVLDRATNFAPNPSYNRVASMAATGFGLVVIANAAERGLVDRSYAEAYLEKVLRFSEKNVERRFGWFRHFVDFETGVNVWNSEYSTIDTALFLAGALYASEVFPNSEISKIATRLYAEVDFHDMLTDGGAYPNKKTLTMGYVDGRGYISTQWHMYAEQMILLLLGLGHPTEPLPIESWYAFDRTPYEAPRSNLVVMGLQEALFVHQYSQLFVDFRGLDDGFKNYHQNSVDAARYHRELLNLDDRFKTLREGFWGFSAGDAPGDKYEVANPIIYSSTVCIGCTVGSYAFIPNELGQDMVSWLNGPYRSEIWGRYGFVDSLDLDQNWFSPWVLGITVGPVYMSVANSNPEASIWRTFMKSPAIQRAFARIRALQVR